MKVTKREFVKAAAAVAIGVSAQRAAAIAGARLVAPGALGTAPAAQSLSFDVVIYNDWFPQARGFVAGFPAARALAVGTDAGQLWYGTLRKLVKSGLRRVAGVSSHTDLLILETLAREAGLKVRSRLESGRIVYWTITP